MFDALGGRQAVLADDSGLEGDGSWRTAGHLLRPLRRRASNRRRERGEAARGTWRTRQSGTPASFAPCASSRPVARAAVQARRRCKRSRSKGVTNGSITLAPRGDWTVSGTTRSSSRRAGTRRWPRRRPQPRTASLIAAPPRGRFWTAWPGREGADVDDASFAELVADALDSLPVEFLERMENVEVMIEDWPSRDDLEEVGLSLGTRTPCSASTTAFRSRTATASMRRFPTGSPSTRSRSSDWPGRTRTRYASRSATR